jgi:hypothetical protein
MKLERFYRKNMTIDANIPPLKNPWQLDWFPPQTRQDSELLDLLGFIPGLREFLMLRQVHALEHATVWVLSEIEAKRHSFFSTFPADDKNLGGLSTEKGFYLYGSILSPKIKNAAKVALERIKQGEWHLALHPRCGTNASVGVALTAGSILIAHILLPKRPIEQLIGFALATAIAEGLKPELGMSVQKYLTTAIPFNLEIGDVRETTDVWGRSAHFVDVRWQDS